MLDSQVVIWHHSIDGSHDLIPIQKDKCILVRGINARTSKTA